MKKIILASGSPRRLQLLQQIGFEPIVLPSGKEENPKAEDPAGIVQELSCMKAGDIAEQLRSGSLAFPEAVDPKERESIVVLGADTVVAADGRVLGKPKSHEEAAQMIRSIAGRSHSVFTGVTLIRIADGKRITFAEETKVHVHSMSEEEILAYANSEEPMDKAGAYGIQGAFGAFIDGIEGDYSNVVGLPVGCVYQAMKELTAGSD